MSNHRILPLLLALLLVPAAVPATASASGATAVGSSSQSRLGRGFGTRSPGYSSRYRTRPRYTTPRYRRPFTTRRFFGGVLKALGIAYLFHMLFGWGAGGSPLGLLLLLGIVVLLVTRRRRRPLYY